jgi:RHS repeat-associated protein
MPSQFAVSIAAFLSWLMLSRPFSACGRVAQSGARLGWIALLLSWLALPAIAVAQTALVHDGVVSGAISVAGEQDEFTFEASAGESALIRAVKTEGTYNFVPYIWLYNPDGTRVATNYGDPTAALDCSPTSSTCKLNQTGTYRLLVMDSNYVDAGSYEVHYVRPGASNQGGSLVHDGVASGSITVGDINSYVFEASAGESALIRAVKTGGTYNFVPYIWLYNPDGTRVATNYGDPTAALDCSPGSTCKLNQTGTYRLLVMDNNYVDAGSYEVHYVRPGASNQGGSLVHDGVVSGSITVGDINSYVFEASAGESALIRAVKTGGTYNFVPYIWLYNPDGTRVATNYGDPTAALDCSPGSTCKLNQTGTYRLLVMDNNYVDAGSYEISFDGPPQPVRPSLNRLPLDSSAGFPTVTQDHSCRGAGCVSATLHHAGLDLVPRGSDLGVYAVAGGTVTAAVTSCTDGDASCNSGYGNSLIIQHATDLYTLYAHLKPGSIAVTSGAVVTGQRLAEMGRTGFVTGAHLHFEVKSHGGLKDSTDTYFSYTPTHPNNYGYLDPWAHLPDTALLPTPLEVLNAAGLYARRGPGSAYSALTEVAAGQRFVAFARFIDGGNTWYRIHLPCGNGNTCAGWVAGAVGGTTYSALASGAVQLQVNGTGVEGLCVRAVPGGSILDKVYNAQRFVYDETRPPSDGCATNWYHIDLPAVSGVRSGWVCGDYVALVGSEWGAIFSLQGTVSRDGAPLSGVNLALTGSASAAASSGADGNYAFSELRSGSYTITPARAGHEFSPASRPISLSGASLTGLDFRACDPSVPLSGYVVDAAAGNTPLAGVTVSAGGLADQTDSIGYYEIRGLSCTTHTVSVVHGDYADYQRSHDRFAGARHDITLTNASTAIGITPTTPLHGDPVNTATGNYVYQRRDLEIPGIGMPFRFDRSYNSRAASDAAASAVPLGYGWSHSYQVRVSEAPDGIVTLTWGDGHTETHTPDGLGGYTPQYGVFDTLTDNGDGTFSLEKRDRTVYDFDTGGRLSAITDKNGNTLALAYTGAHLTGITDTAGRAITLDYDPSGRITQITDPIGRTVQYAYDANGDLIEATDPNGNLTQYTYDAEHQILTVVDPRGHTVVTNTYDGANRVVTYQTDAKGNGTTYAYEELDRVTTITDALGNVTVHHHDELLRLTKEQDARGGVALYAYDEAGNRVAVTDKNGNLTQYQYDERGNVTRKTDALGNVTTITYDADDNPLSRTDALGNVTQFAYDANGNLTQTTDALGHIATISYDTRGLPRTVTDPNGNVTTNAYDAEGNLIQVTDALGNITAYSYDGVGRRLTATDALGRVTTYSYDANDNLLSVTDPLGGVVTHTFDGNDNKLSSTDRNGNVTQMAYDEKDLLVSETDALGHAETYTYDALDRRLTRTDRRGHTTQYAYDTVGNRIGMTDALGNVTSYAYDLNGNRLSTTDARGNATTFAYDALNRQIQIKDALGNAVVTTYDALGRVVTVTAPGGRVTQNSYDVLGHLTQTTDPEGGITRYGYDANGNRISRTDANDHTTTTGYDALNRVVAVTDPLGHSTQFSYDAVGNRITTTDAFGHTTQIGYDALNRPVSQTDALGYTETTAYDAEDNVTQRTDANGQVTAFAYDVLDRLTLVTDAAGGTVLYAYDANGNRTSMTDPNGQVTTYAYDALNRRTAMTEPLGHVTSLAYDAVGNLIQKTDPKGQVIGYSFDAVNRRTGIDYPAQPDVAFAYDAVGNLLTMTDGLGTTTHTYDLLDRRTSTTDPFGQQVGYGYDALGNRVSLTYPGARTVTYAYDDADRLTTVTDWLGNVTTYSYDDANRLTGTENDNGTTTAYGYDDANRLTGLTNAKSDASLINAYSYTLDAVGNHLAEDRTEPLSPQLTAETVTDTHDAENRLTQSNGIANSFDANGNLTAKGNDTYTYDQADRLVETSINGTLTQYRYDALGNRYSRTRAGSETRFVLDTNTTLTNVLMETDGAGNPLAYNVYGQGLISRILPDDSVLTYHYDSRGSTIAITDSIETSINRYAYDPFGRVANTEGTEANPFGFLGRHGVIDEGEHLSYIRARYYDSEQQRFVSKDANLGRDRSGQTMNRFAFAIGNPVRCIDISGFSSLETTGSADINSSGPSNATTFVHSLLGEIPAQTAGGNGKSWFEYLGVDSASAAWEKAGAKIGKKVATSIGKKIVKHFSQKWFSEAVSLIARPASNWVGLWNNVHSAIPILNASRFSNKALAGIKYAGDLVKVAQLYVGGYEEVVVNRGYSLKKVGQLALDADLYRFAAENPDALLQALNEGVTSVTAVTVNALTLGITEFSGEDVENAAEWYVDKVHQFGDAYQAGIRNTTDWVGAKMHGLLGGF